MRTKKTFSFRAMWLINDLKTLHVLQPLPLDQVIHGLFPQQDREGQRGLYHPGDTINNFLCITSYQSLSVNSSLWLLLVCLVYLPTTMWGDSLISIIYLPLVLIWTDPAALACPAGRVYHVHPESRDLAGNAIINSCLSLFQQYFCFQQHGVSLLVAHFEIEPVRFSSWTAFKDRSRGRFTITHKRDSR